MRFLDVMVLSPREILSDAVRFLLPKLIILVMIAAAIVAVVLLLKKRKKSKEQSTECEKDGQEEEKQK